MNRPLTVTNPATGESGPGNSYTSYSYLNGEGPVSSTSAYDESGNLTRTVNVTYGLDGETLSYSGSTEPTSYSYDGLRRLHTLSDGNGHATTYTYNTNGFLASVAYPNANATTGYDTLSFPSYDAQGNLLESIDGRGIQTDYTYGGPASMLSSITYPATTSLNSSYSYDSYGRVIGVTDGAAAAASGPGIVPSYDDDDDTTSVQTTYLGPTAGTYLPTQTISYTFNPDGSAATMLSPAGTFSYGYDGDERPSSLTNPFSETTGWSYLNNGWLSTQSLANGVTTTNTFNPLGQLLTLTSKNSASSVLTSFSIPTAGGYDGVGNLLSRADTIAAATSYSGSTSYEYDAKNQLTQEASTRGSGYTNNFAYDGGTITGAGNPTSFKGATNTYNSDNQLTNTGYTYDGEGNPTSYKGNSLTFDANDNLAGYGTALTNGYLSSGLRAWKQNSSGTRTYFLYAGSTPVCELDSSGDILATNTFGASGLVSRHVGSTSTFYTFDPQGGNAQRLDSSGSVLGSSMFDAYGANVSTDGSTDPFSGYGAQWGYYADQETGLSLCTNRFYDPGNGRWVNRDPIGYSGGTNVYSYCGNNPVSGIDPAGLQNVVDDEKSGSGENSVDNGGSVGVSPSVAAQAAKYQEYSPDPTPQSLQQQAETEAAGENLDSAINGTDAPDYHNNFGTENSGDDNAPKQPYNDGGNPENDIDGGDFGPSGCAGGGPGGNCFIADTPVHMADGSVKPIEKISVGNKVATRNIGTGKSEKKAVLRKTVRLVHDLVVLHFAEKKDGKETDRITTTPGHPFYVAGTGFVLAGNLAVGNAIVTRTGPPVYLVQIDRVHSGNPVAVYNLTVQDDHTYFVGTANGGEWVHNTSTIPMINVGDLPPDEQEAVNTTINNIDNGTPGPGRWGFPHQNREGNLPPAGPNGYSEYYVPPNPGQAYPGPYRVVVNNDNGNTYFTWNHYGQNGATPPFVQLR